MRNAALALSFVVAVGLGVFAWLTFTSAPAPLRDAFERPFIRWWIDKVSDRPASLDDTLSGLADYRQVQDALLRLERDFDDDEKRRTAVRGLNMSILAEGGDVFVEYMMDRDTPLAQTFVVIRRTAFTDADDAKKHLVTAELRRLDHSNVVAYFSGRADAEQPSVFLDRLEASALYALRRANAQKTNVVDHAVTEARRAYWDNRLRPGLFDAMSTFVDERSAQLKKMESRMSAQRISIDEPERLVFGDAFFETLEPYADALRPGGPLIFSRDLDNLERFEDEHAQDAAAYAAAVVDIQGKNAAAQSAYRALFVPQTRTMNDVPAPLLRWVGEDSEAWALAADGSMRGALGGIINTQGSPCLILAGLAVTAQGAQRRSTDRYFAANTILEHLHHPDGAPFKARAEVAEVVKTGCADEDSLRETAKAAYTRLYGTAPRTLTSNIVFPAQSPASEPAAR